MTKAKITLARDNTELPEYPLPSGTRLEAHSYFKFHYDRWLNSDFYTRATQRNEWAVLAIAQALWCKSRYQNPVGTLPNDDGLLAGLLGMSVETWQGWSRRDLSPLYGWHLCQIPGTGEIRLMHDVVAEVVLDAIESRDKNADRAAAERERTALARLRKNVADLGDARLSDNPRFIVQLHHWLGDNYPKGNRTVARIMEGMEALGVTAWRL